MNTLALVAVAMLAACSREPEPVVPADGLTAPASLVDVAEPLAEPTEAEMRALAQAETDKINRDGGMRLQISGVQSSPIYFRLDGFRKTGCKPYTKAYRCDGEVTYSYPGSDFPQETLRYSRRYQRDSQGNWTAD
ncbi:MAG: hypothetical protein ACK4UT_00240 [Moraxellaceae bacterium]